MAAMIAVSFLLSLFATVYSASTTCRDEKGSSVDWFINYKLPKLEDRNRDSLLGQGLAYAYLRPNARQWTLSERNVSTKVSMLGHTLQQYYQNKKGLTYLLYNDEPSPDDFGTSVGHTKGVVVFDGDTGFWIVHSIPKFPGANAYDYPSSGMENGQSILCVTFSIDSLNEIGKQLLYNAPLIYSKKLHKSARGKIDDDVATLFSNKPNFVRADPFERVANLRSYGNMKLVSFAKDNQFNEDLYSALIAPELKTSLLVETWRRGSGTKLDPDCSPQYEILDVMAINMTVVQKRRSTYLGFSSMEDHSKWAIGDGSKSKWICIGDINRMESQKKRGGGALCFISTPVWRVFNSSISSLDSCRRLNK